MHMYVCAYTHTHTYIGRANIHSILHVPSVRARRDAKGSPDARGTRTHEGDESASSSMNKNSDSGRAMMLRAKGSFKDATNHFLSALSRHSSGVRRDPLQPGGQGAEPAISAPNSTGQEAGRGADALRRVSLSVFRPRTASIATSVGSLRSQKASAPAEKGTPAHAAPTGMSKLRGLKGAVAKLTFANATKKLSANAVLFGNKSNGQNSEVLHGDELVRSGTVGKMFACVERHWACDVNSIRVRTFVCMYVCMSACMYVRT
jgi:hypothetical protein